MDDGSGKSLYEHDLLGRVTKVTNADGKSVSYSYGEDGPVSEIAHAYYCQNSVYSFRKP